MIRAVLFDVGGTLHEVHREPELEIAFCEELLNKLAAADSFPALLRALYRQAGE